LKRPAPIHRISRGAKAGHWSECNAAVP
jgi:hypothetical protein